MTTVKPMNQYPKFQYLDVRRAQATVLSRLKRQIGWYLATLLAVASAITLLSNFDWRKVFLITALAGALGVMLPLIHRRISLLTALEPLSKAFAAANNFDYRKLQKPQHGIFMPAIDGIGFFDREEQVASGMFGNHAMRTYIYTFRHLWANRYTRVPVRVYEVTLPKRFPHVFLATRRASGGKYHTSFMRHYDDDQRIGLEGNFDQLFVAYTHRRTVTEALSILAPNVMQTLIDSNKDYNIEIIGDKLYLYSEQYEPYEDYFKNGFTVLEKLMKHIDHQLKSWKFTLPNDSKYPFLRSRAGFGTVTIGGRYFNASLVFIIASTVWNSGRAILQYKAQTPPDVKALYIKLGIIGGAALILFLALFVFRAKYKSSLRAQ